jgi:hypothetical protein
MPISLQHLIIITSPEPLGDQALVASLTLNPGNAAKREKHIRRDTLAALGSSNKKPHGTKERFRFNAQQPLLHALPSDT